MTKYSRDKSNFPLIGAINVPSDKSITHRAILFSALANGISKIQVFEPGRDNLASIRVMQNLGVKIDCALSEKIFLMAKEEGLENTSLSTDENCYITVCGSDLKLKSPRENLYCGNSGTTARLLTGILAGQKFSSTLSGDASLSKRPFKRVRIPLEQMGAKFSADILPLEVSGGGLSGISYESPVASAQIKSAVLLAGLSSEDAVSVIEPRPSRDHTERMFEAMGIALSETPTKDGRWQVTLPAKGKRGKLSAFSAIVPADFSSAAFFIVAALIVPGSKIEILNVGFNKTRIGLFTILKRMGAKISFENQKIICGEEVRDIIVESSKLLATSLSEEDVVLAIDEIPILCVAAAFAEGTTQIRGAKELRVKESDRLSMMEKLLTAHGLSVKEYEDGLDIKGKSAFASVNDIEDAPWQHCGDHRIVMSSAVLSYALGASFMIEDVSEIQTSFPNFIQCFQELEEI